MDIEINKELERTSKELLMSIEGLSEAQFAYKINPQVWSIHQCLEHMVITEIAVFRLLLQHAPSQDASITEKVGKAAIEKIMNDRSVKVESPDDVKPVGRFNSIGELLEKFRSNRERLTDSLNTNKIIFDSRLFVHPMLGEMTKKDWLNFLIHHCDRHCSQMNEIRSHVQFQMI